MPLYSYSCTDCGADLEILHRIGSDRQRCGLDCRRQGEGSFGQGAVVRVRQAPNLSTGSRGKEAGAGSETPREAMRREALRRVGGGVTEADLEKLQNRGIAVYRRQGEQKWAREGGPSEAPATIEPKDAE